MLTMFADKQPAGLSNSEKGAIGELVAVGYLYKRGWRQIERNVRVGGCELDIIAVDPDGILATVEVKFSEKSENGYSPEVRLNPRKIAAVARGLQMFADKHPRLAKKGIRVDAVCLVPHNPSVLTDDEKDYVINYYKNILSTFAG